jgi:hypothetical protein
LYSMKVMDLDQQLAHSSAISIDEIRFQCSIKLMSSIAKREINPFLMIHDTQSFFTQVLFMDLTTGCLHACLCSAQMKNAPGPANH